MKKRVQFGWNDSQAFISFWAPDNLLYYYLCYKTSFMAFSGLLNRSLCQILNETLLSNELDLDYRQARLTSGLYWNWTKTQCHGGKINRQCLICSHIFTWPLNTQNLLLKRKLLHSWHADVVFCGHVRWFCTAGNCVPWCLKCHVFFSHVGQHTTSWRRIGEFKLFPHHTNTGFKFNMLCVSVFTSVLFNTLKSHSRSSSVNLPSVCLNVRSAHMPACKKWNQDVTHFCNLQQPDAPRALPYATPLQFPLTVQRARLTFMWHLAQKGDESLYVCVTAPFFCVYRVFSRDTKNNSVKLWCRERGGAIRCLWFKLFSTEEEHSSRVTRKHKVNVYCNRS